MMDFLSGNITAADAEEDNQLFSQIFDYTTIQLSPRAHNRNVRFISSGTATIYEEFSGCTLYNCGTLTGKQVGLMIPIREDSEVWWGSLLSKEVVIARSGHQLDILLQNGSCHLVVLIHQDVLEAFLSEAERECLTSVLDHPAGLLFSPTDEIQIQRSQLLNLLRSSQGQISADRIEQYAVSAFASFLSPPAPSVISICNSAAAIVAEAIALDDASTGPVDIPAIQGALGVGRRSLELAFRKTVDCSPHAFFHRRRLCQAQQLLRYADPSVETVASISRRCGFTNPGRFAGQYRDLFGTLPADVLRAACLFNLQQVPAAG